MRVQANRLMVESDEELEDEDEELDALSLEALLAENVAALAAELRLFAENRSALDCVVSCVRLLFSEENIWLWCRSMLRVRVPDV